MNYLYTPNLKVAQDAAKRLDDICGYPNPPTKTERAVMIEKHPTKELYIVPIPDFVYGPKVLDYIKGDNILPEDRKEDIAINTTAEADTKLTDLSSKGTPVTDKEYFSLITPEAAEKADFWPTEIKDEKPGGGKEIIEEPVDPGGKVP